MDMNQNYAPEMNTEVEAPAQPNGKPLKKKQYLFSAAPLKTRIMSFVALGLAALFVLLVIIGTISALTRPIWDIPFFPIAVGEAEMEDLEDQSEDAYDALKDAIRNDDEAYIEELEDRYDTDIKEIQKILKNPSLLNGSKLAVGLGEKEGLVAFGALIALVLGTAIITFAFALPAALLLNKALLIVGYILGLPFFILFAGTGFLVAATVVLIAFIVMQTIVKKAYKNYKKSFAN